MRDGPVFVVIPCFRAATTILDVIAGIGPQVQGIVVVDDGCPQRSGALVRDRCADPRVSVVFHERNQGVGGACITGFVAARDRGAAFIVKMDADGQMDPNLVPRLVDPLRRGEADYVKGNRFFDLRYLAQMPRVRVLGNAVLSFLTKLSCGYWEIMDPTNGFIALDSRLLALLPLDRISRGYFFETDLLFRLNTLRAVVRDLPMPARYSSAESQMRLFEMPGYFLRNHLVRIIKRIFYNYFLRDFSIASLQLVFGMVLMLCGFVYGGWHWHASLALGRETPTGIIMVTMLLMIIGFQLLMSFLAYDMSRVNTVPISRSA